MCAWVGVRGGSGDARGGKCDSVLSKLQYFLYQLVRLLEGPHNYNCVERKKKFRLLSHNNLIFLRSEGFSAKGACWNEQGVQACVC